MSISARHRSPLLHESPDLPKDFYSFQSAAQPGGALFCSSLFEVIYQLYPTANVFCAIDISVYKTAISSLFHMLYTTTYRQFREKLQNHCNFRGSATLSRPVSMQSIQLCRLHSFSPQVYSFRQCRQIVANHESNICSFFCPYHFNLHLSFSHPFCYHICIQRALCRKARSMFFDLLGGEQQ